MSKDKPARWFQCAFDHDRQADGTLPPAVAVAVIVAQPTMVDGKIVDGADRMQVDAVPGTRWFTTTDPRLGVALAQLEWLDEISEPSPAQIKQHKQELTTPANAGKER